MPPPRRWGALSDDCDRQTDVRQTDKRQTASSLNAPPRGGGIVFLGLSVLDLVPMYATDVRQTGVICASSLNAPTLGAGHSK